MHLQDFKVRVTLRNGDQREKLIERVPGRGAALREFFATSGISPDQAVSHEFEPVGDPVEGEYASTSVQPGHVAPNQQPPHPSPPEPREETRVVDGEETPETPPQPEIPPENPPQEPQGGNEPEVHADPEPQQPQDAPQEPQADPQAPTGPDHPAG